MMPYMLTHDTPRISIVIPIFNEAATLPELYRRLTAVLEKGEDDYEIVFVNDGSQDRSWDLIRDFCAADPHIHALRFSRNFGHQEALSAGLGFARGQAVILMDGDLQDPPELLPQLIAKWQEGYEVIYTVKLQRQESVVKRLAFWGFYRFMGFLSAIRVPLDAGIFSLLDRKVVDQLRAMPERNRYIAGLRAWTGFRQASLPFSRGLRHHGAPRQSLGKLCKLALDGFFSFSYIPIRLVSIFGLIVSALAFASVLIIVCVRLFTDLAVSGWASIMTAVAFLGGVQLVTIGIIGEYIGRVYDEVKQRPLYIIAETIGTFSDTQAPESIAVRKRSSAQLETTLEP
jgi:polyisoprenyl-phosphate glycosyltransferase